MNEKELLIDPFAIEVANFFLDDDPSFKLLKSDTKDKIKKQMISALQEFLTLKLSECSSHEEFSEYFNSNKFLDDFNFTKYMSAPISQALFLLSLDTNN